MPSSKSEKPASFSIDEFIGEIEKAEAATLNKRLPQERLKNKRALDNAARRAAEKAGTTGELVPQPLIRKSEGPMPLSGPDPDAGKPRKEKKQTRSAATGMSLKAPKSKANSVIRPTNLDGFGETEQAGFGHVSSAGPVAKVKTPGSRTPGKKVALPGQNLEGTLRQPDEAVLKTHLYGTLAGRPDTER